MNAHAFAADTAQHGSLQQCRPFPGGAEGALGSKCQAVLRKPFLIRLKPFPGNVAGMHVTDQILPFLLRHFHGGVLAIRLAAGACATVDECASVTWVVQDLEDSTILRFAPQQFSLLVAGTNTTWEPKPLLAEEADSLHGRAGTLKGVKHQADGAPGFLVGIEPYAPVRKIDQANGRSHL